MIAQDITISKIYVYDEVAKTTSYTGAKSTAEGAYERIFTTDDDRLMLERFWVEACAAATSLLRDFIVTVNAQDNSNGVDIDINYEASLDMPASFDVALMPAVANDIFSFFVAYITGKWYKFTEKEETEPYMADAALSLTSAKSKLYYKTKPVRKKIAK